MKTTTQKVRASLLLLHPMPVIFYRKINDIFHFQYQYQLYEIYFLFQEELVKLCWLQWLVKSWCSSTWQYGSYLIADPQLLWWINMELVLNVSARLYSKYYLPKACVFCVLFNQHNWIMIYVGTFKLSLLFKNRHSKQLSWLTFHVIFLKII